MTEIDWPTLRRRTSEAFGELPPHPEVEDEIVAVFEVYPDLVVRAINEISEKVTAGKVRSGWRVLRREVLEGASPRHQEKATLSDARQTAIHQAELWIRTAGIHSDSEQEILAELFGATALTAPLATLLELEKNTKTSPGRPYYEALLHAAIERTLDEGPQEIPGTGGPLAAWAGDSVLRERMLELWRQERPRGQLLEAEMETRAAEFVLQQKTTKAREAA